MTSVGAAPHLPAGILSPYSDGEREAPAADFANRQRLKRTPTPRPAPSPRPMRGEVPGRAMRGGADADNCRPCLNEPQLPSGQS
ncbi:hypothetical protein EOA32_06095 [Mesorhizobium sp. M1A.F.Ca.ET.072.01.1.1]|nr:hypothetical protein EOA32_06095 [Mesorhizobium sp. M1A.F.Ca.ET.072.01.1.1]TIU98061.1 MAG: hypothetical protein E5W04_24570 [Mesorhizobium sp.]